MIRKGDTVRCAGGPAMKVLAASDRWAICGWDEAGTDRVELFQVPDLVRDLAQEPPQEGEGEEPAA